MAESTELMTVDNICNRVYIVKATDFCPITDGIACP